MNLEQLKEQYEKLGQEIAKLEATPKPWPQEDDPYYCLQEEGTYVVLHYAGDSFDVRATSQGNIFRTEAEAVAERDARAVVAELRMQKGYRRFIVGEYNYTLRPAFLSNVVTPEDGAWQKSDAGWHSIYFDSVDATQAAIQAVGEARIIKAARWWAMGEV